MTQNDNNEALMGSTLNKAMLADAIAEEFSIDRVQAKTYVESFFRILVEQLAQGGSIKLAGLGKFCVREKNARPGPQHADGRADDDRRAPRRALPPVGDAERPRDGKPHEPPRRRSRRRRRGRVSRRDLLFRAHPINFALPRRGVAQPGSALAWGARGREFESRRPDQKTKMRSSQDGLFYCVIVSHSLIL